MIKTHILGYPRIGSKRELKFALEGYWKNEIKSDALHEVAKRLRKSHWLQQSDNRLDYISALDFSFYDIMLDHSLMFNTLPERIAKLNIKNPLSKYFLMARGKAPNTPHKTEACDMTKWFDTNYHYIRPEIGSHTNLSLNAENALSQIDEAHSLRLDIKPVLIGPVTFLWLAQSSNPSFNKLDLLGDICALYRDLLNQFYQKGVRWVQIDEPALALQLPSEWKKAYACYRSLISAGPKLMLTTYFESVDTNISSVAKLGFDAIHLDLVRGSYTPSVINRVLSKNTEISLGIVDGRNIWRNDVKKSIAAIKPWLALDRNLWIGSSCSLLHSPIDAKLETSIKKPMGNWLSFSVQKLGEIELIRSCLEKGASSNAKKLDENQKYVMQRKKSPLVHSDILKKEMRKIKPDWENRNLAYKKRAKLQNTILSLPIFPTTTIGSMPQTAEIRKKRSEFKTGKLPASKYDSFIKNEIAKAVKIQEDIGLDVLVHGEPERNDMVEFFGERLKGFLISKNGWVQSYGSRCVKPPIIYGDIERTKPMTISLSNYASSLTKKPVKGMLTGPNTILCWSFVRDDQPRDKTCLQLAYALRKEVLDLEKAKVQIIQIDEPALREGMPLKKKNTAAYLKHAIRCFKLTSAGVEPETQIHTHMCYSDFNDIMRSIIKLDADVITIETSRSQMALLEVFEHVNYPNQIGPGVYDIHAPNTPSAKAIEGLMEIAMRHLPKESLWINPDCGLKTRTWDEVIASLKQMVSAAKKLRQHHTR